MQFRAKYRRGLGISLLSFVCVALFSLVPLVRDMNHRITDVLLRSAPAKRPPSPVIIVSIDDASLNQYGRWPWSRTLLADLVRRISASHPQVIGLDILLSEPESASADTSFAQAISGDIPAVIVDKIGAYPEGPRWVEPLRIFRNSAAAVGHAQAVLDSDGVCRRFPPRQLTIDGARYAFAIEVAKRVNLNRVDRFLTEHGLTSLQSKEGAISTAAPNLIPIAYRSDGFLTVSAAAVLDGRAENVFRGRPVLIGFGPAELGDRIPTPLSTALPTPGVEVHAQILDAILGGRYLQELPSSALLVLLLALCTAVVLPYRNRRGWRAFALLAIEAIVAFALVAALLWWRGYILPAATMVAIFITGPVLSSTLDIIAVERAVNRQIDNLQAWLVARHPEHIRSSKELFGRLEFLQELEAELGSLYELHRSLLGASQDLVAVFDHAGRLMLSNSAFRQAWGEGATWPLTVEEARARLIESDEAPLKSSGATIEGEALISDVLYFVRIVPLPPTSVSPAGGTILNMTSLRARMERDRARAESLGFVTHELRTPLVSIQGFAELMLRYPASPACARAPETIFRESRRMLALVNSYLDVLRVEGGGQTLRMEPIPLYQIIREVVEVLEPIALASAINLQCQPSDSDVTVAGDGSLLRGAALNLVSNALKYGDPSSEVRVWCECDGMEAALHVQNRGPLIPEQEIESIFRPYVRGQNSSGSRPGWGLGLTLVKRIVDKHGGSVSVVSNEVQGTVFTIRLQTLSTPVAAAKEA